jgi:hypothetical protein
VYFRPELTGAPRQFFCGVSPEDADDEDSEGSLRELEDVDFKLFEEVCWPALYERAPEAFAAIKRTGGWAGFYEVPFANTSQSTELEHATNCCAEVRCELFRPGM